MDLIQCMRVFVRVVESGNFTAAATALNVTTAYTSRAVADLEEHLQTRLIYRTTRKFAITEAGERFLAQSRHILEYLGQAEAEAKNAIREPSGKIRIHSMNGFGARYVIPLISLYMKRYPLVEVELTLHQRMPDLIEEGLDISLVAANTLKASNNISRCLGTLYSVLCASPDYVARHGCPQKISDLDDHTCLNRVAQFGESQEWVLEGRDGKQSYSVRKSRFLVNLPEALAEALACGMGVGVLPVSSFAHELEAGRLVRVLPDYRLDVRNIYAIYPSRQYLDAKVRSWVEFVSENLPVLLTNDALAMTRCETSELT